VLQLRGIVPHFLPEHEWIEAIEAAIRHDQPEARTGDMPGPVKRAVVDPLRLEQYEDEQMEIMGLERKEFSEEVRLLVKVADLIDEMFHVNMEVAMGNSLLIRQVEVTRDRFHAAVRRAGLPWEVAAMVEEEISRMQSGFYLPANKPETDVLTAAGDDEIPF